MSEKIIAKFIKTVSSSTATSTPDVAHSQNPQHNIPREKLIIMTKCCALVKDELGPWAMSYPFSGGRDYVNQWRLSRAAIFNAVEKSLERLETPYIDLLQIHRADPDTPFEETMCALNDLVRSGKVRYIGASSMWTWQFAEYNHVAEKNGWTQFISMQNHYNLLYREEEREMIPYCLHKGIGLIPWAPLAAGTLARPLDAEETQRGKKNIFKKELSEAEKTIVKRVEELSKKHEVPMSKIALSWTMAKVSSPIVGFSSVSGQMVLG